jgi:hypothetical protein
MRKKFVVDVNDSQWSVSYIGLGEHGSPIIAPLIINPLETHPDDIVELREELFIRIQRWLENIYADISKNDAVFFEFRHLFSDLAMMKTGAVKSFVEIHVGKDNFSAENVDFVLAFYKAISLFLEKDSRIIDLDAYLVHLYSTWQWYALQKYLLANDQYNDKGKSLNREFSKTYKKLNEILSDDDYTYAIQYFVKWFSPNLRKSPLLREHLKISLILWNPEHQRNCFSEYPLQEEFAAENSMIDWRKLILHRVFSKDEGAQKAVRAVVTQYTFPRYDLETSLNLARLLANNKPNNSGRTAIISILLTFLEIIAALLIGTVLANSFSDSENLLKIKLFISLGELITFVTIFYRIIRKYDLVSFVQLSAPRIFGGVMIGYLTILLQGDSATFNNVFWENLHSFPVFIFWALVLIVGFGYLFFDTFPQVRDNRISIRRATTIFLLSLLITTISGMVVLPVITSMYPITCTASLCSLQIISPFGDISFAYALTFIPLALLTGLVTQFIFEDRTVTAPVWSPEEN